MIILIMTLWAFFRGTTKNASPPKLHLREWFKGFELNPIKGMLMVFIPIGACCSFIRFVVGDINPLEGVVMGDLKFEGTITPAIELKWRDGRIGICVLALGFNLMQNGSALLCPRRDKPGSVWLPGYWQRQHIMYTSALLFVVLLMALEFSFSSFFSQNALAFMMVFKVVWIYMESWLLKTLNEKLVALPFECALQTAQFVMTLGADGFIQFITGFIVELLIMVVKRIAMDPIKFKVVRTAKLKVKIAQAQKAGQPVPVYTPELEAIGVMIDMLQSMYRFSVDSLGTVISPITIAVLFFFRKEYEISKLYGIRDLDLLFYMLFSLIMIPALWIGDIFLHNTLELIWNWKLFEYIEFCTERFRNRARRWVGLDTAINEELPSDLRTLDQMCFSPQFFFLGSLHASGIVMSVLGYMLVLHKGHNMFGDVMVSPLFAAIMVMLRFIKIAALRAADVLQIWMVEGEKDFVEEYDEGPLARRVGAIPPGMAAVDALIAECVEDALSVGHTDESLIKLLEEAARLGPNAQASIDSSLPSLPGPYPAAHSGTNATGQQTADEAVLPRACATNMLFEGVAPPAKRACGTESDVVFADFMSAFRKEMQESNDRKGNLQRFVPSKTKSLCFPAGVVVHDVAKAPDEAEEEEFEWPQELLTLGLGADAVELNLASSTSSTSPTSTTTTSEDEWPKEMLM